MREIKYKFLGLRGDKSVVVSRPFTLGEINSGWPTQWIASENIHINPSNLLELLTPLQFTGLKDKNGKEIYEGDILRCRMPSCSWLERVKYIDGWKLSPFAYGYKGSGYEQEIIGNIYENPELLKSSLKEHLLEQIKNNR